MTTQGSKPLRDAAARLIDDIEREAQHFGHVHPKMLGWDSFSALKRALSAPPPAVAPQGWQPIETAPKDGSWVDIWATKPVAINDVETHTGWRMAYCRWKEPGPFWDGGWDGLHQGWTPTHWMHMPTAPEKSNG